MIGNFLNDKDNITLPLESTDVKGLAEKLTKVENLLKELYNEELFWKPIDIEGSFHVRDLTDEKPTHLHGRLLVVRGQSTSSIFLHYGYERVLRVLKLSDASVEINFRYRQYKKAYNSPAGTLFIVTIKKDMYFSDFPVITEIQPNSFFDFSTKFKRA